jgi:hypothetical protein
MGHRIITVVCAAAISLACYSTAFSQESPVEKQLAAPGARATMPVTAANVSGALSMNLMYA